MLGSAAPDPARRRYANDVRVQRYRGRPVLTWWEGTATRGHGAGVYVIVDEHYHRIATLHAGNGVDGDGHEFLLTPRGTALITFYRRVRRDLSSLGGPRNGVVLESGVQELDVATGRVVFEWHSIDHVPLPDSYAPAPRSVYAPPYDYFHVNSVAEEPDGDLLVSARNTWTVYDVSRRDGGIRWRLGGKRSDFRMGAGTFFAWQHDARPGPGPGATVSLFDDGAAPAVESYSHALVLRLDLRARTATLVRSLGHPERILSGSQGNAQALPGGRTFVGWGAVGRATEFDPAGRVLLDLRIRPRQMNSYRAYRFVWTGRPLYRPTAAARTEADGSVAVYASWNGATRVQAWQVLAGPTPRRLSVWAHAPRSGFETAIRVQTGAQYVAVRALGARGKVLRTSPALVRTGAGWVPAPR